MFSKIQPPVFIKWCVQNSASGSSKNFSYNSFDKLKDNNWRKVLDSLLYKRSVFIITLPTSIPGEIEHYKKKLEALGYDVEITTKKLLKEFIHDMRDQLDPIYYMGIDSYLNKFMMAWEEK